MICPWKDTFVSIAVLFFELINVLNITEVLLSAGQ